MSQEVETKILPSTADDAPKRYTMIARKDFRDRFESEKATHEKLFAELFGGEWSIKLDPANLFTYTKEGDEGVFGYYCNKFFADAKDNLKNFIEEYGDDGKGQINSLAHTHTITIEPTDADACGLDFLDGKFRILFAPDAFTNAASYWARTLGETVAKAEKASAAKADSSTPAPRTLSIVAKRDIRDRYDPDISKLLERARGYLACPELTFEPNFEANFAFHAAWEAELRADPDERALNDLDKGWEGYVGYFTYRHFEKLVDWLRDNEFPEDDMLQEGFKDAVHRNVVTVREVPDEVFEGQKGYKSDAVVEDGVLVLRTSRKAFGWNLHDTVRDLMGLL